MEVASSIGMVVLSQKGAGAVEKTGRREKVTASLVRRLST